MKKVILSLLIAASSLPSFASDIGTRVLTGVKTAINGQHADFFADDKASRAAETLNILAADLNIGPVLAAAPGAINAGAGALVHIGGGAAPATFGGYFAEALFVPHVMITPAAGAGAGVARRMHVFEYMIENAIPAKVAAFHQQGQSIEPYQAQFGKFVKKGLIDGNIDQITHPVTTYAEIDAAINYAALPAKKAAVGGNFGPAELDEILATAYINAFTNDPVDLYVNASKKLAGAMGTHATFDKATKTWTMAPGYGAYAGHLKGIAVGVPVTGADIAAVIETL